MAFGSGLIIAAVTLATDRVTKWIALEVLDLPQRPIEVAPFFNLVMVWNSGISFGLFSNDTRIGPWLLSGFALTVTAGLLVWLRRAHSLMLTVALGLVLGGAVGNVIDRILWGRVADFVDLHLGNWHWPVFNVADAAIVFGFGLIVLDGLLNRQGRSSSRT